MITVGRTLWVLLLTALLWASISAWQITSFTKAVQLDGTCNTQRECEYTSPIATLELASSSAIFTSRINQKKIGEQNPTQYQAHNIQVVTDNTWIDFLYIPLYWSVFVLFSRTFQGRLTVWITLSISIAAIFDLVENVLLLCAMANVKYNVATFLVPGPVSHIKWSSLAVASLLLGLELVTRRPWSFQLIAVPMIMSGLLTFLGQFYFPLLDGSVLLLLFALLATVVVGFPFRFSRNAPSNGTPLEWLNYLYFVRFSILLWLTILTLAAADSLGITTQVTLGILTPETYLQLFFASFFIVVSGWLALTLARIVCAYGEERFSTRVPSALGVGTSMAWSTFLFSQGPGLVLLDRVARNANYEGLVGPVKVIVFLSLGAIAAFVFWMIIAILYYWTYQPKPCAPPPTGVGGDFTEKMPCDLDDVLTARAFLIPNSRWLRLERLENLPNPPLAAFVRWWLDRLAACGAGYSRLGSEELTQGGELHSGHAIALFLFLGFLSLYIGLMPVTAPLDLPTVRGIVRIVVIVIFIAAILNFVVARKRSSETEAVISPSVRSRMSRHRDPSRKWYKVLAYFATAILVAFGVAIFWQPPLGKTFPVVASVFVLFIFITSTMSGLAFWADRFRIPVLLLVLSIITLMNVRSLRVDHVFKSVPRQAIEKNDSPKTPGEVLYALEPGQSVRPLIIITATGGGIQSAEWTAEILKSLEERFQRNSDTNYGFHDSILLFSTVSGGSVGAAPFLREYDTPQPFKSGTLDNRLVKSAGCSSLEAVAWGLIYPDLARLVAPGLFRFHVLPVPFDRGMTLEEGLRSSLTDPACHQKEVSDNTSSDPTISSLKPGRHANNTFFPAFTLNTTTTETGDRFLLANYQIQPESAQNCLPLTSKQGIHSDVLPAESFLEVYAEPCAESPLHSYSDLLLTTAARLSATFTYVSPAVRIDTVKAGSAKLAAAKYAYHFVDGGYYDNDGTSSVIEFLRTIEKDPKFGFPKGKIQPILLIEIRDGSDVLSDRSPDSYSCQVDHCTTSSTPSPWGPWRQFAAPGQAMYLAGHESVTRRNRRELCLLEDELNPNSRPDKAGVLFHHVVFPLNLTNNALSWHLTQQQIATLRSSAPYGDAKGTPANLKMDTEATNSLENAVKWFEEAQKDPSSLLNRYNTCEIYPQ
jgi:hypothetical protein